MHDDLIERRLRSALRAEGDALPLTITAAELERRSARFHRRRGTTTGLLIAATIGLGLVGLAGVAGGWYDRSVPRPSGPAPSAIAVASGLPSSSPALSDIPARTLPTLDDLVQAVGTNDVVLAQANGPAEGPTLSPDSLDLPPPSVTLGPVSGDTDYAISFACLGEGSAAVGLAADEEDSSQLPRVRCDATIALQQAGRGGPRSLRIESDSQASWRVVVRAIGAPAAASTTVPTDLPAPSGVILATARSEHDVATFDDPLTGGGIEAPVAYGELLGRLDYTVQTSCAGPRPIRYAFGGDPADGARLDIVREVPCDGLVRNDTLRIAQPAGSHLYVIADSRVAWQVAVSSERPPFELSPHQDGWDPAGGGGPDFHFHSEPTGLTLPIQEGGGRVLVVVSCSGEGSVPLSVEVGKTIGAKLQSLEASCSPGGDSTAQSFVVQSSYIDVMYQAPARSWLAISIYVPSAKP
jgi:hypothetical protein